MAGGDASSVAAGEQALIWMHPLGSQASEPSLPWARAKRISPKYRAIRAYQSCLAVTTLQAASGLEVGQRHLGQGEPSSSWEQDGMMRGCCE